MMCLKNKSFDDIGRMLNSSEDEEIIVLDGGSMCGNRDSQKAGGILNYRASYKNAGFHFLPLLISKRSFLQLAMPTKVVSLAELREHTTKDSIWVLLHSKGRSRHHRLSSHLTISRSI
jgi:hypothetical protein